jgi:lipopolysaccharide biosynthesis glycosyltransferase
MGRSIRVYSVVSNNFRLGFLVMARTLLEMNPEHEIEFRIVSHPELSPLHPEYRQWLLERVPKLTFHEPDLSLYQNIFRLRDKVFKTPKRLWAAFFILEVFADEFEGDVISLDSDMICLGELEDDLFAHSGFGAVEARHRDGQGRGYFNTGVMSIARSHRGRSRYLDILNHTNAKGYRSSTGKADQALLSLLYRPNAASSLPWRYNVTRRHVPANGVRQHLNGMRAVFFHYVGAKPWHVSLDERDFDDTEAEELWDQTVRQYLTDSEYITYLEEWRDSSRSLAREHTQSFPPIRPSKKRQRLLGRLRRFTARLFKG